MVPRSYLLIRADIQRVFVLFSTFVVVRRRLQPR